MNPILILQNCETESEARIGDVLSEKNIEYSIHKSYENRAFPSQSDFDAFIILGSFNSVHDRSRSVYLEKMYHYTSSLIRSNRPILGICFGSQLLAHIYGARVESAIVKEIGKSTVTLSDQGKAEPLFNGLPETFDVFQWHGETFRVPFDGQLLATGNDVKNQAFRVGKSVGLQFHCELKEEDLTRWSDHYSEELNKEKIRKDDLLSQYHDISKSLEQTNRIIISNFLKQ